MAERREWSQGRGGKEGDEKRPTGGRGRGEAGRGEAERRNAREQPAHLRCMALLRPPKSTRAPGLFTDCALGPNAWEDF